MATDALARRLRFAPPSPRDEEEMIIPQEADFIQWAAISRHGPLPISYLHAFTQEQRQNYPNLQRRYTRFYHQGWVVRPARQYASFHARYSPLVYDLTPKAKAALANRACAHPPSRSAPFIHQLMQACFTASVELAAPEAGFAFVGREEILAHPHCQTPSLALQLRASRLIPDDLFAIERTDGKRRFFLLEIDRNTESIERASGGYNTWAKKVAAYDEVFGLGIHRQAWGIPNATVLIVTTNERHAQNLRAYIAAKSGHADRYQVMTEPTFDANWRVPKELLPTFINAPWMA